MDIKKSPNCDCPGGWTIFSPQNALTGRQSMLCAKEMELWGVGVREHPATGRGAGEDCGFHQQGDHVHSEAPRPLPDAVLHLRAGGCI